MTVTYASAYGCGNTSSFRSRAHKAELGNGVVLRTQFIAQSTSTAAEAIAVPPVFLGLLGLSQVA
jgi:hypothetical protein